MHPSVALHWKTSGLRDFGYRDQSTRSGLSVPANIAEGYERRGKRTLVDFLKITKGSAGELKTQILLGRDANYLEHDLANRWADEADHIARTLGVLIRKHDQ